MFSITAGIALAIGAVEVRDNPDGVTTGSAAAGVALIMVLAWLFQAGSEEIVVRGFMFQSAGRQLPTFLAVAVPAVVFTALHLLNPGEKTPVVIANLLMFSVFAAFIAVADRGLWLVIGIHTGWNWFQGNVFGVAVSGESHATSIMSLTPGDNSAAITGGDYGLEGSISATIVLILALVASLWWMRRRLAAEPAQPALQEA